MMQACFIIVTKTRKGKTVMKRLLSVLSVFCILWLIMQVSVWDKPDSLSPTEQDMHEGNADSDYASPLPTDSIHS